MTHPNPHPTPTVAPTNHRARALLAALAPITLATAALALLLPASALADITNGGAKAQSIFNGWAQPAAACMIVAGAIHAFAKKNMVAIVTFLVLVLVLGGFVIDPSRGLSVSDSLLSKILG